MVENRTRFSGKVTDKYGKALVGAKIIFTDQHGVPKITQPDDKVIGTYSEANGYYGIQIPSSLFHSEANDVSLTARYSGQPNETISIYGGTPTEIDFILGAKVQEEDEMTVVACKSFKCKVKKSFAKNKKAYIFGIIGLVLLAVAMTLIFSQKK